VAIFEKHSIPIPPHWDTNLITPGTPFMNKLNHHLHLYFEHRFSRIPSQIIHFTGSDERGEGEHKIMDFIRSQNQIAIDKDEIDSNIYSIYGLDADLIMLSLLQKQPIYLLRESVHFGSIDLDNFLLFDIHSFKNKIIHEMTHDCFIFLDKTDDEPEILKTKTKTKETILNLDDVIDDYVIMGFLLGNDFLPKITSIETNDGCISKLMEYYKDVIKVCQSTIVRDNKINFNILSLVLSRFLVEYESISLKEKERRLQHWKPRIRDNLSPFELDLEKIKYENKEYFANLDRDGRRKTLRFDEPGWEERFYREKLHIMDIVKERPYIKELRERFVDGIEWVYEYYKGRITDWQWRYGLEETVVLKEIVEETRNRFFEKEKQYREPISMELFTELVFPPKSLPIKN
jgi:5'-3' exonuclease